jgi:hypothetical protein
MMIYVGLDDTDTLDTPGRNQLARHLVRKFASDFRGRMIVRHQLLEHPQVPCTRKNGCASILLEPHGTIPPANLISTLRQIIVDWCPVGSDPGLCIAESVPMAVVEGGQRCKQELVTQDEARRIAAEYGIHLEGLAGTQDGIIGALAAIGLVATGNDGRVVHLGSGSQDFFDIGGSLPIETILACGVSEIQEFHSGRQVKSGVIDVGKRLRPNYRGGRTVLFVAQISNANWQAVRAV